MSIKVILLLLRIERRIEERGLEEEGYYYVLQMKLIKCN